MFAESAAVAPIDSIPAFETRVVPRRILAFFVDSILLGVGWWLVVGIAAFTGLLHLNIDRETTISEEGQVTSGWYVGNESNQVLFFSYWVILLGIKAAFERFYGQTPGKMLLGIRVVSEKGREGIDWKQALIRNVLLVAPFALILNSTVISGLSLIGIVLAIAGCVSMAASGQRQRLGDRAADTMVVRAGTAAGSRSLPPTGTAPDSTRPVRIVADEWVRCSNCMSDLQGKHLPWGVLDGQSVPLCPNCRSPIELPNRS